MQLISTTLLRKSSTVSCWCGLRSTIIFTSSPSWRVSLSLIMAMLKEISKVNANNNNVIICNIGIKLNGTTRNAGAGGSRQDCSWPDCTPNTWLALFCTCQFCTDFPCRRRISCLARLLTNLHTFRLTYFQVALPSAGSDFASIGGAGARIVRCAQARAVEIRVVDVCEEQLAVGAHLEFEVAAGVGGVGGHEELHCIGIVEGVIALGIVRDHFLIEVEPCHI